MKMAVLVSSAALAACATNGAPSRTTGGSAESDAAWQEARAVDDPVDCIQALQIAQTYVRSPEVIDFRLRDGRMFRNTLRQSCGLLNRPNPSIGYKGARNRLCSINVVQVLPSAAGGISGSCGLGSFQEIEPLPG